MKKWFTRKTGTNLSGLCVYMYVHSVREYLTKNNQESTATALIAYERVCVSSVDAFIHGPSYVVFYAKIWFNNFALFFLVFMQKNDKFFCKIAI